MTRMFGHDIRSDLLALCLAEIAAVFLAAFLVAAMGIGPGAGLNPARAALIAAILAIGSALVAGASGLYQPEILSRLRRFLVGAGVAVLLLIVAWLSLAIVARPGAAAPARMGELLLGCLLAIILTRLTFSLAWRWGLRRRRLIVLDGAALEGSSARNSPFEMALEVSGADHAAIREALRAQPVWAVVAQEPGALDAGLREACARAGVRILTPAEIHECRYNRIAVESLPADWLGKARGMRGGAMEAAARRACDILAALLLLALTLPLMAGAALAIRWEGPGPILYFQDRIGLRGRVFSICKFRSMVVAAEAAGAPRWATKQDPRVTRVGRFMRLTRIDELPQIFNVLRGDMSFVGPRPERPGFVAQLGAAIPHYNDRACVKPGITGWAQVNYPYGASVEDARMKLAYDLYYVQRRSLFLDLLIVIATVRVVMFQEGAR